MLADAMLEEILQMLEGKDLGSVSTGAKVPYHWLRRVVLREVKNPRIDRLELVKAYLVSLPA